MPVSLPRHRRRARQGRRRSHDWRRRRPHCRSGLVQPVRRHVHSRRERRPWAQRRTTGQRRRRPVLHGSGTFRMSCCSRGPSALGRLRFLGSTLLELQEAGPAGTRQFAFPRARHFRCTLGCSGARCSGCHGGGCYRGRASRGRGPGRLRRPAHRGSSAAAQALPCAVQSGLLHQRLVGSRQ